MSTASAAVLDIEITRKFPELNSLGDVDGALVLFRLHGRPLGWGAAAVTAGRLDTPALVRQLLDQHAWSCALALTERALLGQPPSSAELLAAACRAYRVREVDVSPLIAWCHTPTSD